VENWGEARRKKNAPQLTLPFASPQALRPSGSAGLRFGKVNDPTNSMKTKSNRKRGHFKRGKEGDILKEL
jgi:hypothetical protein